MKRLIPAPPHAVIERLKQIVKYPEIIEKYNEGRHPEDRVNNEMEYLSQFFGLSERTIYRRLKSEGVTISKIRRSINDLDVEKVIEVYNLSEFTPIQYEYIGTPMQRSEKTNILVIGDLQIGAYYNAHGRTSDPVKYVKRYFDVLKQKIEHKFQEQGVPENLIITLVGDLVDGENIYIGQDVMPVHKQASFTADILYDFIQYLYSYEIHQINVYSVRGNHGNLSKYYSKESNWDNVVAELLKIRYDIHHEYGGFKNVHIHTTKDAYMKFSAGKWNVVIHHGDFVKGVFSRGTTSFNTKPLEQHIESMKLTKFNDMDALIIGHWHRFHFGEILGMNYVVNGTCYESDFVQSTLMSKESLMFVYITVGDEIPFEQIDILYLGESM